MYLEPVELRDFVASQLTSPHKITGSINFSERGVTFESLDTTDVAFHIPDTAIQSVAVDYRRYYTIADLLGYGLLLTLIFAIGSLISIHNSLGYLIMGGSLLPLGYLIYNYYQSQSAVVVVQTAGDILEFEITDEQKEEALNFIKYAEEL